MQIDVSSKAPKIISLKKEVIVRKRRTYPLLEEVFDLFTALKKNEVPKEGKSSFAQHGLDYIKEHRSIPKSELRGAYRKLNTLHEYDMKLLRA
jgi:hypothetical protein